MRIKNVRKLRKNVQGDYEVIHYETNANQVLMSNGKNLEETLADKTEMVNAVLAALPDGDEVSY